MDPVKLDRSKMTPTPTTYKIEQRDDRKILSNRQKSYVVLFNGKGSRESNPKPKLERFLDLHVNSKKHLPALTKYNVTADQKRKILSSPPRSSLGSFAHKR